MAENNALTRLQFVEDGAARAASLGSQAYAVVKQHAPAALKPRLEAAEAKAVEAAAPFISKGAEALKTADVKVSWVARSRSERVGIRGLLALQLRQRQTVRVACGRSARPHCPLELCMLGL